MRVISVLSQKGGAGKSSLSVNLAVSFAKLECKVLLVDLDYQCDATFMLGATSQQNWKLETQQTTFGCDIVAGSVSLKDFPSDINIEAVSACFSRYDFIILDTHPSLGQDFEFAAKIATEYLIPIVPEPNFFRGLNMTIEQMSLIAPDTPLTAVVISRFNNKISTQKHYYAAIARECDAGNVQLFTVPETAQQASATLTQVPLAMGNSAAAKEYHRLATFMLKKNSKKVEEKKQNEKEMSQ